MKTIAFLLMALLFSVITDVRGQSCPTGVQECYWFGKIDGGSSYNSLPGDYFHQLTFNTTSGNYCPAARLNCTGITADFGVRVTRISGNGSTRLAGGTYTTTSPVTYNFLGQTACGSVGRAIEFLRSAGEEPVTWQVELIAYQYSGNLPEYICYSDTYTITLNPIEHP